mgnify:CR=1 FL=1
MAPDKSNSPLGVVAISPDPQNTSTLVDSSPTTLVISDAPTQQTPTAANSMIMRVDIAPAVRRKTLILAKSTPNPVAKSLFEPERAPIAANRTTIPFLPSLEDEAYVVVRNFVCIFPSWKDYTADTEQFPVFLRKLCVSWGGRLEIVLCLLYNLSMKERCTQSSCQQHKLRLLNWEEME